MKILQNGSFELGTFSVSRDGSDNFDSVSAFLLQMRFLSLFGGLLLLTVPNLNTSKGSAKGTVTQVVDDSVATALSDVCVLSYKWTLEHHVLAPLEVSRILAAIYGGRLVCMLVVWVGSFTAVLGGELL